MPSSWDPAPQTRRVVGLQPPKNLQRAGLGGGSPPTKKSLTQMFNISDWNNYFLKLTVLGV